MSWRCAPRWRGWSLVALAIVVLAGSPVSAVADELSYSKENNVPMQELRTRLAALEARCSQVVVSSDPLADYFTESLGIINRQLKALTTESRPAAGTAGATAAVDATSARLRDVYEMEARGLLDFLAEELDVHAMRKQLRYEEMDAAKVGLVGDGKTNNRPALDKLLGGIRREKKAVRLVFPAGDYYFADPSKTAAGSIVLDDVENLIIEGRDGARLVTSGASMAGDSIRMTRCRNIILRNLTLDMDPLPFVFGTIMSKDDNASTIEIELLPSSPMPDASYWRDGQEIVGSMTIREAGTCHYVREAGNGLGAGKVKHLQGNRYHIQLVNATMRQIPIGASAVWHPRGRNGCGQGLSIRHSRHILVQDVRMQAAETVCVWPEYSGGLQFINCDFVPPDGRPALVNADGFHVPGNIKGPYLENCRVFGPADDCLNFYSPAFSVADWDANSRSLILLVDFPGDPNEFFAPGDSLALVNSNTGVPDAVATIVQMGPADWASDVPAPDLRYSKRALRLTLDRDVQGLLTRKALGRPAWSPYHEYYRQGSDAYEKAKAIKAPYEHLAVNLRYVNSGFIIRKCRFGYNRALGFKCKAGNGVIRDSHFVGQAVLFETSLTWREGFLPHDIEMIGTRVDWFCFAQLGLLGKTVKGPGALHLMPRIRFENCRIARTSP